MKKIFALLTVLSLSLCFSVFNLTNKRAVATTSDFDCTYSAGVNYASNIITYTEDEATLANLPSGYTGSVLKVDSSATNKGITLDFSSSKFQTWAIESITFRVYISSDTNTSDGYPELRIKKPNTSDQWTLRYSIAGNIAKWVDVVIDENAYFKDNNGSINDISKNGYLDKFEFILRHQNVCDFYIDSIKVNFVKDTTPPVITYNGANDVTIAQGQPLNFDVSAIDEVQGNVDVELVWGDTNKLDGNGYPKIGTHTLTFKATDHYGNTATHTINVTVVEADVIAPEILLPTNRVVVKVGTIPFINLTATDDKDQNVTITYSWSANALNFKNQLTAGEHTLTVTATDASGNSTVKTITFIVTATGDDETNIVDEEQLFPSEDDDQGSSDSDSDNQGSSDSDSDNNQSSSDSNSQSSSSKPSSSQSSNNSSTKKGCKGLIATTPTALVLLCAGLVLFIKKSKRENKEY